MSEYMMLSSKNVFDDQLSFDAPRYLSAADFKTEDRRTSVAAGDVLLTIVGTIGRTAVVPADAPAFTLQRSVAVIRPDNSAICSRFLMYALMSGSGALNAQARGVAQKGVYLEALREFGIDHPPLPEQRRIVAVLDEAFEGIATAKTNAEKNLQNVCQVFENHLERVFSRRCDVWPETSLGAIAAIKGGKRVPKGYKLLDEDTGYPYLRVTDFGPRGAIDMGDLRYVSPAVHAEIKNYTITPRDLYISIAGTIGRTGIIPEDLEGANLTENACRLVFKSGVSNRFVYYYTRTPAFIEQAGLNTRTAAQPKLALSRLATIRLPMPKFEIQASVVAALDAIAESVEVLDGLYRAKSTALGELRKALLHRAFTGDLTAKSADKQMEAVA